MRDTFATNLKHKRSLIEQANEIVDSLQAKMESGVIDRAYWDEATKQIQALQAEWKTAGAVVRKYSDALWAQFSASCDTFFNTKREAVKEERIRANGERVAKAAKAAANQGADSLRRMRDRLRQEIKTAENNILFFTAKSKTANKLVDSMQQRIDQLKKQLDDIQEKIDNAE